MSIELISGERVRSLEELMLALSKGKCMKVRQQAKGERGLIVTRQLSLAPANYQSSKPYWLSKTECHAIFVPNRHIVYGYTSSTPCNAYGVRRDGSMVLMKDFSDLASVVLSGYVKVAIDASIDQQALGAMLSWYRGKFYYVPQYSTTVNRVNNTSQVAFINHQDLVPFEEENTMQDLSAVLFGEELYAVSVVFPNALNRTYDYKSVVPYQEGDQVVVDTPSNGLQVVKVTACSKGLPLDVDFAKYKWIVGRVDMAEYKRLIEAESNFIKQAKENAKRQAAIKALAELGVSAEEYKAAILGTAK